VPVTIDGSAPQWFILDTGNGGGSVVARECADRLQLGRGAEQQANIGAGSGAVSIDGRRTPMLTLDEARERFRSPVTRSLEVRRGDQTLQVRLAARRLVWARRLRPRRAAPSCSTRRCRRGTGCRRRARRA
jgi:hypothetical protein